MVPEYPNFVLITVLVLFLYLLNTTLRLFLAAEVGILVRSTDRSFFIFIGTIHSEVVLFCLEVFDSLIFDLRILNVRLPLGELLKFR